MAFSEVTKKHQAVFSSQHLTVRKSHVAPGINDFNIIKPISRGAFGQVYLARRNGSSKMYALKAMKKRDVKTKNMMEQVVAERDALAISSKSPFVVQLYYSFQSDDKIFLVMEYMIGGDIKSLLHNLGFFEEHMARFYVAEVVLALEYLHNHSIFHRDIKPDNMLLSSSGHVKLTDFGLSCLTSDRKPSFLDLMNTPGAKNKDQSVQLNTVFWRTPGQLQSLTSKFTFSLPRTKQNKVKSNNEQQLSIISSLVGSKEFAFSPPQVPIDVTSSTSCSISYLSTPRMSKISSTPNSSDVQLHNQDAPVLPTGSTGLTADVDSLILGVLKRKRNFSDMVMNDANIFDEEKENVDVAEGAKRKRVCSQSLPYELETSHEVTNCLNEKRKSNVVTFADKIHTNMNVTTLEKSNHDLSCTTNISGVTALTETSRMSISACESALLSPYNPEQRQKESSTTNTHADWPYITPSPQQTKSENSENMSPSLTPKTVLNRNRQSSEKMLTPVQMLNFFDADGKTPDGITSSVDISNDCMKIMGNDSCASEQSVSFIAKQTPHRTPKSCVRGKATPAERRRILGTPDYLAPEILLGKDYGAPVDWWALGVCFYEFLTGIPPFNDDSPELVFEHILEHDLIWPQGEECLSDTVVEAIECMLTDDPIQRSKADEIKIMECFTEIDWDNLRNLAAPFVPQPDDIYDTTYFDAKNYANRLKMSDFKP